MSETAPRNGVRLHHHVDGGQHRHDREREKENDVHQETSATTSAVASRFRNRGGEEELPGETHELVVTEARQRAANPDEGEQDRPGFSADQEQRQQPALDQGNQKNAGRDQENHSDDR